MEVIAHMHAKDCLLTHISFSLPPSQHSTCTRTTMPTIVDKLTTPAILSILSILDARSLAKLAATSRALLRPASTDAL